MVLLAHTQKYEPTPSPHAFCLPLINPTKGEKTNAIDKTFPWRDQGGKYPKGEVHPDVEALRDRL